MTAREVLDALADELEIPFLERPRDDGALLDLLVEGVRGRIHDDAECLAICAEFGEF